MRKKMTSKKIVAIGLSLLMLGSSESVQILAESLESESAITVEETSTEVNSVEEVASVAELAEPTELETLPVSEESVPVETMTESAQESGEGEVSTEWQTQEAEEVSSQESTLVEQETSENTNASSDEQSSESASSAEEVTSELSSAVDVETEVETETDTELESEAESEQESETEEMISEEETESDGYLADSHMYGDYQYQIEENGEATITKYYGTDEKVVVPDTIDGHVVTSLAERAFEYNSCIEKVILPDKIVKIKGYIFCNCTSLKEIVIPKSVTEIGESAFSGCTALTKVTFEEQSTIKEISRMTFNGCIALEKIINLPTGITKIDYCAFAECKLLKNIEFPESLQYIGRQAFKKSGLKLECLDIPKNVYAIGSEAFSEIYVKKIFLESGEELQIGSGAFENCNELEQIDMNNRSVGLAEEAFAGCSSLTEIDLSSVTKIGACAFKGTQIKSLTISVKTVLEGQFAYGATYYGPFTGCGTLKTVILEDGRGWITNYAFSSCESIESIIIPASVNTFGTYAFWEQGNKNLIIYGVSGSYTEEWAKSHNYQFRDVSEGFEDSYKTSEYLVKVIDSASKQPISNAVICINGEEAGTTAEDGTAKITIYGTVTQNVSVAKDGYDTRSYIGMPWNSTEQNVVELAIQEKTIEKQITDMLPDAKLPETTLNGPKINIFGKDIYLFSLPISVDVNWFDNVSIKYDNETQTAKVMIGVKETVKKDFETGKDGEKQYQNMKNFVKSCGEGTNQADMLNKFKDTKDGLAPMKGKVAFGVSGNIAGFIELKYNNGQ